MEGVKSLRGDQFPPLWTQPGAWFPTTYFYAKGGAKKGTPERGHDNDEAAAIETYNGEIVRDIPPIRGMSRDRLA